MFDAVVKQNITAAPLIKRGPWRASIPFYDAAFMTTTANRAVIIVIIIAAITRGRRAKENQEV